jgi:Spy/CpxP family protein refolding chaperone
MRLLNPTLTLLAALAVVGCKDDAVSPLPGLPAFEEAAALGFAAAYTSDPGSRELGELHRLPDALALTEAQRAALHALVEAHREATRAEREALAAILKRARDARQAGAGAEDVRAILAEGDPIRARLQAREAELREAVRAVLTPEQREWLDARRERACESPLTEAQRTEIAALVAAFQEARQTDMALIRNALDHARAAHQAGASREEVRQILEGARAAMERVRAAERELHAAIQALLTPEQRLRGCLRIPLPPGRGR